RLVAVVSKGLPNRGAITHVDRGKLDQTLPVNPFQVFGSTLPVQVVKQYDFITPLQIAAYGITTNKSGATGYDYFHKVSIDLLERFLFLLVWPKNETVLCPRSSRIKQITVRTCS